MKTDVFMEAIIHNEAMEAREKERQERIANNVLCPTRAWINGLVSAYPKMAASETLDEKGAALLRKRFMKEVLLATYGQLHLKESFRAKYPQTAECLTNIYTMQEK
ncbi:MAG: hypothetical protein ACYC36_13335 [Bellilinea sp.]